MAIFKASYDTIFTMISVCNLVIFLVCSTLTIFVCALMFIKWIKFYYLIWMHAYLLHGRTQIPQHFSIPVRFFSASFMSALIWSMPSSMRSSCSARQVHASQPLYKSATPTTSPHSLTLLLVYVLKLIVLFIKCWFE